MGLAGVLLGLGLLVWLAYRGWSVLLLAPLAAMLPAAFAGEPLQARRMRNCQWLGGALSPSVDRNGIAKCGVES